ncbi:MAG: TonB family protein [Cyclobacteriaceae bacterium]
MELRKHPKKDLDRKRPMFFGIGLVIALSCTMVAFEWRFYEDIKVLDPPLINGSDELINEPILLPPDPKIHPPTPKKAITETPQPSADIEIVSDDIPDIVEISVVDQLDDEPVIFDTPPLPVEPVSSEPVPYAEYMPEFPGGNKAFMKYLADNLHYTRAAQRIGLEGKVFVSFVVEKDGSLTDIKVLKGLGGGLDEIAVEALQNSPDWEPGMQSGRKVRVRMVQPVTFRFQ